MSFSSPRHSLWLLLPLMLVAGAAQAAHKKPATPVAHADQLLEFMADWQGDDGQWTDPMTFALIDPAKVKADDARRHGKPLAAPAKPVPSAGTAAR